MDSFERRFTNTECITVYIVYICMAECTEWCLLFNFITRILLIVVPCDNHSLEFNCICAELTFTAAIYMLTLMSRLFLYFREESQATD